MGIPVSTPSAAARVAFTRRQGRALLFCLTALPFLVVNPLTVVVAAVDLTGLVTGGQGSPSPAQIAAGVVAAALLLVLLVSTGAARRLGSLQRGLADRMLGVRVAAPPPARRGPRDPAGWRFVAYQLAKLPVAALQLYAVYFWAGGLVNLSYPLLWGAFRNSPPGAELSPLPVYTPFGMFGEGTFRVATLPGTFAAVLAGR